MEFVAQVLCGAADLAKLRSKTVAVSIFFLLLKLIAGDSLATLYCNRPYTQLTLNPDKPYNAVGFLNNGCTAFLIDANHIVAAAHCFVDGTGAWQPNLRFYPNFHPDRVATNEKRVPRGDVTRVVVGSRVAVYLGHSFA